MFSVALDQLDQFKHFQPNFGNLSLAAKTPPQVDMVTGSSDPSDAFTRVQQVLDQRLSGILGPPSQVVPVDRSNNTFDAETVANNVLGFVQNRLKQAEAEGASPDQLESLLKQAKSGIKQGLKDARDALDGMGLLNDSVKSGIKMAKKLIMQGLEQDRKTPTSTDGIQTIEASLGFRQVEKSAFELQIKTQDGDVVTLKFRQSQREQSAISFRQSDGNTAISASYSESFHSRLSFSVEGDLDNEELTAITDLTNALQGVSETFFDGDIQAAFEQGMNLGYNTDEIVGFSLEMSHSLTSVATTRYREISELDNSNHPQLSGLDRIDDLLDQLSGVLGQAKELMEDADRSTKDLLHGLLSHHPDSKGFTDLLNKSGDEELEDVAVTLVKNAGLREED